MTDADVTNLARPSCHAPLTFEGTTDGGVPQA
jgi:hypothetical protein